MRDFTLAILRSINVVNHNGFDSFVASNPHFLPCVFVEEVLGCPAVNQNSLFGLLA